MACASSKTMTPSKDFFAPDGFPPILVGFSLVAVGPAALQPIVEDDAGDLPSLAASGSVTQKPSTAEADSVRSAFWRGRDDIAGLVNRPGAGEMAAMGFTRMDDAFELGVRQQALVDD